MRLTLQGMNIGLGRKMALLSSTPVTLAERSASSERAAFTVSFRRTSYLDAPFSGPFDKGWTVFSFRHVLDDLDEHLTQNICTVRQPPHRVPHPLAKIFALHLFLTRCPSPTGVSQNESQSGKVFKLGQYHPAIPRTCSSGANVHLTAHGAALQEKNIFRG
jgi:hypothetical protein